LKCSKCSHTWFQEPTNFSKDKLNEVLSVTTPKDEENKQLPVKIKAQRNYYKLLILLALTAFVFYTQKIKDSSFSGLDDYRSIAFSNIQIESNFANNKLNYKISGDIINSSPQPINIKPLTIKIFAKNGELIREQKVALEKNYIPSKSNYNFLISLDNITTMADKIVVESTHWLEQIFLN